MPLISVIIPVYNVAPYLRRCVDSLLAQSFRDFELILIDDGSTDGSADICDGYLSTSLSPLSSGEQREIVVRVIHQPNAGVSAARNRGIDDARGEYVSFVDADDWVEPGFLQAFADEVRKNRSVDCVVQGYVNHEGRPMSWPLAFYGSAEELCSHLFEMEQQRLVGYVWNKVFRHDVITTHHTVFDKTVPIGEDFLFVMTFISHCRSMAVVPFVGYNYFYPPGDHKDYPFAAWNQRLEAVAYLLPTMSAMSGKVRQQFMSKEFKISLYVMRIAYHERLPREQRRALMATTRNKGKNNSEVRLSTYEPAFRILAILVLYVPHALSDMLLMGIRNLR